MRTEEEFKNEVFRRADVYRRERGRRRKQFAAGAVTALGIGLLVFAAAGLPGRVTDREPEEELPFERPLGPIETDVLEVSQAPVNDGAAAFPQQKPTTIPENPPGASGDEAASAAIAGRFYSVFCDVGALVVPAAERLELLCRELEGKPDAWAELQQETGTEENAFPAETLEYTVTLKLLEEADKITYRLKILLPDGWRADAFLAAEENRGESFRFSELPADSRIYLYRDDMGWRRLSGRQWSELRQQLVRLQEGAWER